MQRQYDLRDQIVTEDRVEHAAMYASDEEHSVMEDDSDGEGRDGEYMDEDDDRSSELSIPNESIDFDLVYALHSFAATVEGQANVVKGDSLFLMDDSNSYWWLVRVLKTQEVGYIPAENIETPFERLARLNKHRNVDLASATQAEIQEDVHASRDRLRSNISRVGIDASSPTPGAEGRNPSSASRRRSVYFTPALHVHRYPPAVWNEDEEEDEDVEWDDEGYEDEDPDIAEDFPPSEDPRLAGMEPDDGMSWEDGAAEAMQQASMHPGPGGQAVQIMSPGMQGEQPVLQVQTSRDGMFGSQDAPGSASADSLSSPGKTQLDPAQALETTRKISMTPSIAREEDRRGGGVPAALQPGQGAQSGPLLPSAVMQQQAEERKRTREEIEALEEAARKRGAPVSKAGPRGGPAGISSSTSTPSNGGKLRKERGEEKEDDGKKKKGGMLSGWFKRGGRDKKDRSGNGSDREGSVDQINRESDDSSLRGHAQLGSSTGSADGLNHSPISETARLQQQAAALRNSTDPKRAGQQQVNTQSGGQPISARGASTATSPQPSSPPDSSTLSAHASTLRQRDQQLQALYLNRSPASPPEVQPSYGLASASRLGTPFSSGTTSSSLAVSGSGTSRPRPASLVLAPAGGEGPGVPDLSVIRVFAGESLQTEATFKTVLLNMSTTSEELVRQAMQRFRLPAGEDPSEYYLTVKEVEGSSAALRPTERPLVVFESLVEQAMELPKVKRSSVGSISSVASNLSMHPAIKKLPMNDFTDDSAVKFYLNRRGTDAGADNSMEIEREEEDAAISEDARAEDPESPRVESGGQSLAIPNAGVAPDRFSSPSYRFALQVVIYPEDLPDDMVFDPLTEAIVFKNTLRDRVSSASSISSGVSQTHRRKIFMFPKNVTVAEIIELGLERFGILDGVVDGGDEVEDKFSKRRSSTRVRYTLKAGLNGQERELSPSSRVIDAYPTPPAYRAVDRRSNDNKRRSVDFAQLMGSQEDVRPEDPVFVLRRAVAYRSSTSRHRMSAPLDEIALQHLQRDIATSSSASGDDSAASSGAEDKQRQQQAQQQLSRQQLIAAQREASRANQRALLSTQANQMRGVDLLLPGNAMLRSQRGGAAGDDDRMRYSYVDNTGEVYDISDVVEEEWRGKSGGSSRVSTDLLEGVVGSTTSQDKLGAKLERVLSKIKPGSRVPKPASPEPVSVTTSTSSGYMSASSSYSSEDEPVEQEPAARAVSPARSITPTASSGRAVSPPPASASRSATPTARGTSPAPTSAVHDRQPSIASVLSSSSSPAPARPARSQARGTPGGSNTSAPQRPQRPIITKDDFGLTNMMAIIEAGALIHKSPPPETIDEVDQMLFGRPQSEIDNLHPDIKEIYAPSFQRLEEMDKLLDEMLHQATAQSS